jgi:hypothetical protein
MRRKNRIIAIAGAIIVGGACLTALVWAVVTRERLHAAQFGMLIDYSDSRVVNCAYVEDTIRRIQQAGNVQFQSNVYLFSTGHADSGDEPILMAKERIPVNVRALEGKAKSDQELQSFVDKMKIRCNEEPAKERSPIALGIKRVVENLRANSCGPKDGCVVFVQTDGEELSERNLRNSIKEVKPSKTSKAAIPNEGIRIEMCGFAEIETSAKLRALADGGKLESAWRQMFSQPNLVVFRPHCQSSN